MISIKGTYYSLGDNITKEFDVLLPIVSLAKFRMLSISRSDELISRAIQDKYNELPSDCSIWTTEIKKVFKNACS